MRHRLYEHITLFLFMSVLLIYFVSLIMVVLYIVSQITNNKFIL